MVSAKALDLARASEIGLATVVCPVAELDEVLADLVGAVASPVAGAVRETKALLLAASDRTLEEQRRFEREAQIRRFRELAGLMAGT